MAKRTARPYQAKVINEYFTCLHAGYKAPVIILPTGGGKCLGKDTPVMLADGTIVPVQDIKVGDQLMGPDSKPRNVLSLARGREELFRVTPVKGDSYVVNRSHILSVRHTETGEIVNLSIDEWLNKSKWFRHCHKGWRTGVDFDGHVDDIYLPPYLLGLWLGDGTSIRAEITSADVEIADYLRDFANKTGQEIRICEQPDNNSHVIKIVNDWSRGKTMTSLRDNNLVCNKHIPHAYLTASVEQRKQLLAGLVDSDGCEHHGGYDFCFKSETLVNDVAYLCRSLGLAAYIAPCKKTIKSRNFTGDYFRLSVSGDCSDIPVLLPRKKCEQRQQKKNVLNTGITVESIGEGDYYGFEIDGDHLFLLGDFTVTHNTFIFTEIISMMAEAGHRCIVMCHRSELVRQISMSLATQELHHDFICSDKTRAICGNVQQMEFGRTFYRPGANIIVASVQTVNARLKENPKATPQRKAMREATLRLLDNVTFSVFDESHHLTRDNTFGRPLQYMRDTTKFLLVTATPERADGKGMGSVALNGSGIVDVVIKGPEMRWLIDQGNLCDYKIYEPPTEQADFTKVRVTASGDYNQQDQAREMDKAKITGDVVRHYQELINGKLTIVFCCDISHAQSVADAYQRAGISSAVLHGGDDESTRFKTLQAFERREILVLVTVDLVSEGFDLPAIEAAQFLRRTMSLSWFMQAFGRVLRPAPGKDYAVILDHVGNWREHGLPDKPRVWSMADRKGGKSASNDDDTVPVTRCRVPVDKSGKFTPEQCAVMSADEQLTHGIRPCGYIYEITEPRCPDCGCRQPLAPRGEPVMVKGKLVEVSAEELAKMRAGDESISDQAAIWRQEIQEDKLKLKMSPEEYVAAMHVPAIARNTQINNHRRWRAMQATLAPLMDEWMEHHQKGDVHKEAAQQLFLNRFGINVYYAQVLKPKECFELIEKIKAHLEQIQANGGLTYA